MVILPLVTAIPVKNGTNTRIKPPAVCIRLRISLYTAIILGKITATAAITQTIEYISPDEPSEKLHAEEITAQSTITIKITASSRTGSPRRFERRSVTLLNKPSRDSSSASCRLRSKLNPDIIFSTFSDISSIPSPYSSAQAETGDNPKKTAAVTRMTTIIFFIDCSISAP